MNTENTSDVERDYPLNPETLRKNAKLICEQVQSDMRVMLYKCGGCGQLHMRYISPDHDDAFETNVMKENNYEH